MSKNSQAFYENDASRIIFLFLTTAPYHQIYWMNYSNPP